MEWQVILAIIIAAPLLLLPVAFVWWLNFGGVYQMIKGTEKKKATAKERETQKAAGKNHA